jgi:hypothetical protein
LIIWLRTSSSTLNIHPPLIPSLYWDTDRPDSALYVKGSDYETSDAVFGVKDSLIVGLETVSPELAKQYNVDEGTQVLKYDFVLVTDEETKQLRHDEAVKAMKGLGREGMIIVNGVPVPDVD